jgi:FkbM family methyltransferase
MKKYNAVVATDIGTYIINKNDTGVGWQLSEYGTYDPNELEAIKEIFKILKTGTPNLVALDIGANIGIHSVLLSEQVGPKGVVHAFEPQRLIFNMLAGNIALNSIGNVLCHHNAVTDSAGPIKIPIYDFGKPMSFGSVELGGAQKEDIGQIPISDKSDIVTGICIDGMDLHQINFIKIDVEGMEIKVLKGAEKSINKFRPFILVEYLKSSQNELIDWFNLYNYNIYSGIGANYLCIPRESGINIIGLNLTNKSIKLNDT